MIDGWGISCKIVQIWISLDFTDKQSTLVQVMAWCRQAKSHTWANVDPDLCHHMASLSHNKLNMKEPMSIYLNWTRCFGFNTMCSSIKYCIFFMAGVVLPWSYKSLPVDARWGSTANNLLTEKLPYQNPCQWIILLKPGFRLSGTASSQSESQNRKSLLIGMDFNMRFF